MAGKVLTRHRKNRAGVYTSWEYRFQSASVSGQRKWITNKTRGISSRNGCLSGISKYRGSFYTI